MKYIRYYKQYLIVIRINMYEMTYFIITLQFMESFPFYLEFV